MSLHWYACISTNTYRFEMHHILLETDWWALPNASSIVWIRSAIHEILADKAFTATDGLISQSFIVAFVHPVYVLIALIWGFPVQLSLWKSVHWLWRYKLNKVCDSISACPFLLTVTAGAGTVDISSVVVCLYLLEASSVICKDPSCSDNTSILFVLLELILVLLCSLNYTCFVLNR